jgi:hypothetical protein
MAIRAGLTAYFTAEAFNFVATQTLGVGHQMPDFLSPRHLANIAGHALVGCLSAVAGGARCGPGALSAAAGSFAGPILQDLQFEHNLAAHAVVGGLASVAGGGKFANGAVTAAFGYLFNQAAKAARNSATAPNSADRPELRALADDPTVSAAIDRVWAESNPYGGGPARERGFWIVRDSSGSISISEEGWISVDLGKGKIGMIVPPPPPGAIASFHTHPQKDGIPGPSREDILSAFDWHVMRPGIIQTHKGMYFYGPSKGGLYK